MRFAGLLMLVALSASAAAQQPSQGADRAYPAQWIPLLTNLTKMQVDRMQASANEFCRGLDYSAVRDMYNDVGACTLMQSTAIQTVDSALSDLDFDPPTKYRPDQIKKCWSLYRALGSKDVENLAHCFGDIQYFELLQRTAGSGTRLAPAVPLTSSYCEKVSQASGGSYMIMEECMKQENASRRRLGR